MRWRSLATAFFLASASSALAADQADCVPASFPPERQSSAIVSDVACFEAGMKTRAQVDHWMSCYLGNDSRYSAYLKTMKSRVEQASASFGVPYSLLACLFYTESRWDPRASSKADGQGIAQLLMHPTVREINKSILGKPDRSEKLAQHLEAWKADKKRRKVPVTDPRYLRELHIAEAEIELNQVRGQIQPMWLDYWGGRPPRLPIRPEQLNDPAVSIGLGAMYIKYLQLQYGFTSDPETLANLLFATGAYNLGPKKFSKIFRDSRPSVDKAIELLEKRDIGETAAHMSRIRTCVRNGSWASTTPGDQRTCEPF